MHSDRDVTDQLELIDRQRAAALAAADDLTQLQIWHRSAVKEWCMGEIPCIHHDQLHIDPVPKLVDPFKLKG